MISSSSISKEEDPFASSSVLSSAPTTTSAPTTIHNDFDCDGSSYASQATSKDSQSLTQFSTELDISNAENVRNNARHRFEINSMDTRRSALSTLSSSNTLSSSSSTHTVIPPLHSFPKPYTTSRGSNSNSMVDQDATPSVVSSAAMNSLDSPITAIDFSLEMIPDGVMDIDMIDPQSKTATLDPRYARSIYLFRKQMEMKYIFKRTDNIFFKPRSKNCVQQDITERMRSVLVD